MSQEDVCLPDEVNTVRTLLIWLRQRNAERDEALQENRISVTVNKQFASLDAPIVQNDEIAIIPLRP
jgi:molybdopterin converting factor small subunit